MHLLRTTIAAITEIITLRDPLPEPLLLLRIRPLLEILISDPKWLPEQFRRAVDGHNQQYLLYCDPLQRFSIICSVFAPGQNSAIQEYPVWGLFSVLQGRGMRCTYSHSEGRLSENETQKILEGEIVFVSPGNIDIQQISNASSDSPLITIDIFGGNIGSLPRRQFDLSTSAAKEIYSGYANDVLPNIWSDTKERPSGNDRGRIFH